MLKALLFDLNGIFVQSPKLSERFANDFHVPVAKFLPRLSEIMDKVRLPHAGPAFQYWKPVFEEWGVSLSEQAFWDYWFGAETVSATMVDFAKELRTNGIKIFLLSNNFRERAEYYKHYPWLHEAADKAYFSWQTGYIKPDPQAWLQILTENSLQPKECLFFDDQEKNCTAAQSVGIQSFLFTDEKSLQTIVRHRLTIV